VLTDTSYEVAKDERPDGFVTVGRTGVMQVSHRAGPGQATIRTAAAKTNRPIAAPVAHRLATGRRWLLMAIATETRPRTTRTGMFAKLRLRVDALKVRSWTAAYGEVSAWLIVAIWAGATLRQYAASWNPGPNEPCGGECSAAAKRLSAA